MAAMPMRSRVQYYTTTGECSLVISQRQWLHGELACEGDVYNTVQEMCTVPFSTKPVRPLFRHVVIL